MARIAGRWVFIVGGLSLWLVVLSWQAGPSRAQAGPTPTPVLPQTVVSNCTPENISAAVAAGGDVVLSCGSGPVTVGVNPTQVNNAVRLRAAVPGTVTLVAAMPGTLALFKVEPGVRFEIQGLKFQGTSGTATLYTQGIVTITNSSFFSHPKMVIISEPGSQLTVVNSTFSNNGSPSFHFGGSIYNEGGVVTVRSSTFNNNMSAGPGGAIFTAGTLSITNSTFANNSAGQGGAIYQTGGFAGLTIRNSTFAGNSSSTGAIASTIPVSITNSIIVDGATPSTSCSNLVGSSNIQWPASSPSCGAAFRYADPKLGALANNGGQTRTMALLAGSAAIDSALAACPGVDQRNSPRPRDGDGNGSALCDLGSFEVQRSAATATRTRTPTRTAGTARTPTRTATSVPF